MLLKVLDSSKADSTRGALERPLRPVESRTRRWADVKVVGVLNIFQSTGQYSTKRKRKHERRNRTQNIRG